MSAKWYPEPGHPVTPEWFRGWLEQRRREGKSAGVNRRACECPTAIAMLDLKPDGPWVVGMFSTVSNKSGESYLNPDWLDRFIEAIDAIGPNEPYVEYGGRMVRPSFEIAPEQALAILDKVCEPGEQP